MTQTATTKGVHLADLKRKSVRGAMVTLLSQGISTLVHLVSTVVLARLLSPEDFGVMSMVAAITAFAGLFQDLGLSTAAVQKGQLSHALQSNLFWVNVTMGAILTGTLAAAAPLVARFYQRPELTWVTVALSFNFLIRSLGTQHGVLLTRRMQFGRKAATGIAGSLVGLAVSIYLALKGYRFWALVWGGLTSGVTSVLLLHVVSPFRPTWPSRGTGVLSLVRFGADVTAFNIINYFHRNLDNLLIGKVWGAEALGLYTRAYALLMFPVQAIRNPLNAVAFPALCKLQGQPRAFRLYYRKLAEIVVFLSMPLSGFFICAGAQIVNILLGSQWAGVVPILNLLAAVSFIQSVFMLWGVVTLGLGLSKRYLYLGVLYALVTVIGFVIGVKWGARGVAASYVATTYIMVWPTLHLAFRGTPITFRDFLGCITHPAVASLAATALTLKLTEFIVVPNVVLLLAVKAAVFATTYVGVLFIHPWGRQMVQSVLQSVLNAVPGKTGVTRSPLSPAASESQPHPPA